jgi:hypothetical protein
MRVQVNQPRHHIQAGQIDNFTGLLRGDVRRDARDLVTRDCHVNDAINLICGIDDVPILQKEVILCLRKRDALGRNRGTHKEGYEPYAHSSSGGYHDPVPPCAQRGAAAGSLCVSW